MSKIGETKTRILESLKRKSKTLTDLSEELDLAPSTVAEHIQGLIEMDAIREIDDVPRKWKYYEINPGFVVQQNTFVRRYGLALGAIVVIGLVAVGAFYLGIGRPQNTAATASQAPSCAAAPGYSCGGIVKTSSGTLSMQIGGFNSSAYITGVGCSYNSSQPTSFEAQNITLSAYQFANLNVTCPAAPPASARVIQIWLSYVINGEGIIARVANITFAAPASTTATTSAASTSAPYSTVPATSFSTTASTTSVSTTSAPTSTAAQGVCNAPYSATVYVNQSTVCGPFTMVLVNLAQPNATGASAADFDVLYNGTLTNTTQVNPGATVRFSSHSRSVTMYLSSTFDGLYAYERWAKVTVTPGPTATTSTTTTVTSTSTSTVATQPTGCGYRVTLLIWQNDTCAPFTVQFTGIQTLGPPYYSNYSIYFNGNYTSTAYLTPGSSVVYPLDGDTLNVSLAATSVPGVTPEYANITVTDVLAVQHQSCNALTTDYIEQNVTCSGFSVRLTSFGQPNATTGISAGYFFVYYNGAVTNITSIQPGKMDTFVTGGQILKLYLNATFDGLYAYQKWSKVLLNVTPVPQNNCNSTVKIYTTAGNAVCSGFTVVLDSLSSMGTNVTAAISVYYKGALTNVTAQAPGKVQQFNVGGDTLSVFINSTYAGTYANQQWAVMSLGVTPQLPIATTGCNRVITMYVGQNDTCAPFTIKLSALGSANATGVRPADIDVWFLGTLTNVSAEFPGASSQFVLGSAGSPATVEGQEIVMKAPISSEFAGHYAFQQYATLRVNVTGWPANYQTCGTQLMALYPGSNDTCKSFTVQMVNITRASGSLPTGMQINVYYNKVLTNSSTVFQSRTGNFVVAGHRLSVYLNATAYNFSYYNSVDAPVWAVAAINST